jgi:hypothetical protein
MVEPITRSSGPPIANWPILLWHHHCDRLAEGADEGVLLILLSGENINLFSDLNNIILFYDLLQTQLP